MVGRAMAIWTDADTAARTTAFVAVVALALVACAETEVKKVPPPEGSGETRAQAANAEAASATEAKVNAPAWLRGSTWLWSDGYGLRVKGVKDNLTVFVRTDAPGQWYSRRGFLREEAQDATRFRKLMYRTIKPDSGMVLVAGKPLAFTREFLSDNEQRVHLTSWMVEGRERVSVPAGTFDCWIIVMRTRSLKTDWTAFERWWYSDKVQNYVRLEYRYGPHPAGSRVLMSYQLAARN